MKTGAAISSFIHKIWKKNPAIDGGLIILAIIFCYIWSINAPFLWDDEIMVVGNPFIQKLSNWKYIFTHSAFGGPLTQGKFYRPLQILSYLPDYFIWGLKPFGFRLTNILLHSASSIILYRIILQFGFKRVIALLTALIFAIHPLAIEAVTYISGRGDGLNVLLALLSVHFFLFGNKKGYFLSVVACFIALLAKENSIILPIIMLIYTLLFLQQKKEKKWAWVAIGSQFMGMIGYLIFKFTLLPVGNMETLSLIKNATLWERIITGPYILWTYIRLIFWPFPLHMEYLNVEKSLFSIYLVLVGLMAAALVYWGVKKAKNKKWFIFLLAWFLLGLAPVSQIILPLASTVREHWAYFPAIGIYLLIVVSLTEVLAKKRMILIGILGVWMSIILGFNIYRNLDWNDPIKFFSHDLKYEPQSFVLYNNLGVENWREKDFKAAKENFQKSIETSPHQKYGIAHNNLGVAYLREKNDRKAEYHFKRSIDLNKYRLAFNNLAALYLRKGRFVESIKICRMGLRNNGDRRRLIYILKKAEKKLKNP